MCWCVDVLLIKKILKYYISWRVRWMSNIGVANVCDSRLNYIIFEHKSRFTQEVLQMKINITQQGTTTEIQLHWKN